MEKTQSIRFTSATSTVSCHNIDDMAVASSSLSSMIPHNSNSFSISSSEVIVKVDPTTHTSGSSAVATRNITNYPWDLVYIPGNLVAVHSSGNFIAYAIIAPSSSNGIVRIISRRTGVRGLIKNIPGFIKDLAFAYISSRILLAFTDKYGTLFVYEVHEEEKTLRTQLLVEVQRSKEEEASNFQRIIWCPFIPDEIEEENDDGDEENFAYLLVVTNGPLAEIWHIMTLIQMYGTGPIDHSQVKPGPGHQVMENHAAPISDAAFSPDGTALATASLDGYVKFFQVYMADNGSPRCLHQWSPHDGKPLSCLFFLDNHKNPSPDVQFWKYAVTGAANNTEIKTWSCENWHCNQVVKFEMSDSSDLEDDLSLKAAMDPSSKYLILSDIYRRVLYIMILYQEQAPPYVVANGDSLEAAAQIQTKVGAARFISISELPIQYSAIFLSITDAEWKPYKRWKHEHLGHDGSQEEQEEAEEDNDNIDIVEGLVLKCVLINTKSLQDATIRFQPVLPNALNYAQVSSKSTATNISSISEDSVVLKDGLTDLSLNMSTTLSELETSVGASLLARKVADEEEMILERGDMLVSFPSKPSPKNISEAESPAKVVSPSAGLTSLTCGMSESISPSVAAHGTAGDCAMASQPVTMNLLTPESFSSPGRVEDDDLLLKEGDTPRVPEANRETLPRASPSPSEDLKSAAISLLLRGSRIPSSETTTLGTPLSSQNSDQRVPKNIMETVVAGSSLSPPVNMLPPPPRTGPSPLPTTDEAPLATSEVSRTSPSAVIPLSNEVDAAVATSTGSVTSGATSMPGNVASIGAGLATMIGRGAPPINSGTRPISGNSGSGVGLASSTSSPSLEVQQILHSNGSKPDGFLDEVDVVVEGGSGNIQPTQQKDCPPTLQSLQDLIDITAASKLEIQTSQPKPTTTEHSPLIDMFASLKCLPTPVRNQPLIMDQLTDYRVSLNDTNGSSASVLGVTNAGFGPQDTNSTLPLLKGISMSKNHLTCEELEAEIKCSSPTQKPKANEHSSSQGSTRAVLTYTQTAEQSPHPVNGTLANINTPVQADPAKIDKMFEEISSLRQLILSCNTEEKERTKTVIDNTKALSNQVDKSLKNITQLNKGLEELRKSQNKLQDQIPHLIASSSKPIIENCIRQEIRNSLTPAVHHCMDSIRAQISSEIRNLVSNSEVHLTDSLTKAACSRTFIDNVSASVASAVSVNVQATCREAYNKVVVPGFNAISQQVFTQINEAFTRGTNEYLHHVKTESQGTRSALLENVSASSRTLETSSAALSSQVNVLKEALHKNITQQAALSETLGERLKSMVHDEIGRALQEHQAAVEARSSRAQTPAPTAAHSPSNPKIARQQVQHLISQGQFNVAFKQALSASDLSLVVFVCERINPQQLFSQSPCPLSQDVLLSLVNQLSHDLSTFTDLKTKYLEEAVINLDTAHPVTREHMRKVLQEFQRKLASHLEHNPNHKKLKMLLLAVNHLVSP